MAIYEYNNDSLQKVAMANFKDLGIKEREDLQRLLRDQIQVVAPDCFVIDEEFSEWEDSNRRIDLLAIDREANLVVIELKRTNDGGHMELQAIRYASMVSTMTFEQAVKIHAKYLKRRGVAGNAEQRLLDFLEWDSGSEDDFGRDVRLVLVSADFSVELTSAVLWLTERDIDIRCVRIRPYHKDGQVLLDVQQIIPLPEAEEYQVRIKEKQKNDRKKRLFNPDLTKYDVVVGPEAFEKLSKRHTIFHVVRYLLSQGVSPRDVADAMPKRGYDRLFYSVDGIANSTDDFTRFADEQAEKISRPFQPKRYFCEDEQLFKFEDRTYAFSNQWGLKAMSNAIDSLLGTFSDYQISVEANSE